VLVPLDLVKTTAGVAAQHRSPGLVLVRGRCVGPSCSRHLLLLLLLLVVVLQHCGPRLVALGLWLLLLAVVLLLRHLLLRHLLLRHLLLRHLLLRHLLLRHLLLRHLVVVVVVLLVVVVAVVLLLHHRLVLLPLRRLLPRVDCRRLQLGVLPCRLLLLLPQPIDLELSR
jgi:hypothetical protein